MPGGRSRASPSTAELPLDLGEGRLRSDVARIVQIGNVRARSHDAAVKPEITSGS